MTNEAIRRSYDPAFFQLLFEVEDRHFWFRSRNRIIAAWVKRLTSELTPGFRVLEIGCGTGNVLRVLDQVCPSGTVVGMDLFAEGLKYAQQRTSAALVQGDMHHPPFASQFDIIGLFDVLEHLPDDRQVLRDLKGMLRENGTLLLTVPAPLRQLTTSLKPPRSSVPDTVTLPLPTPSGMTLDAPSLSVPALIVVSPP